MEIRNTGANQLDISGWSFSDNSSEVIFNSVIIPADTAVLLTSLSDMELFARFGRVIGLERWPVLNNSGDVLRIEDGFGKLIDSVAYNDSWYGSTQKKQGGWSLERIDLADRCPANHNWTASAHSAGGTPGRLNSVNIRTEDIHPPEINSAVSTDLTSIRVLFSEPVYPAPSLQSVQLYPGTISKVRFGESLDTLWLTSDNLLDRSREYSLEISRISDCRGNSATRQTNLLLPYPVEENSLRLNEVLFDPYPGMDDFLELRHNGDLPVFASKLTLKLYSPDEVYERKAVHTISRELIFEPGEILLISRHPLKLINYYGITGTPSVLESGIFNIPDDGGIIKLEASGVDQDSIRVTPEYHHALLSNSEGHSLERIDPGNALVHGAWSTSARQATPGTKNTNEPSEDTDAGMVSIIPQVLTPFEATNNSLRIILNFPLPGIAGSISVYDLRGIRQAVLVQNEIFSSHHVIRWDGTGDNGRVVSRGYYLLHCLFYGPDGYRKNIRKRILVAW